MPPNNTNELPVDEKDSYLDENFLEKAGFLPTKIVENETEIQNESKRQPIVWHNVILITVFHVIGVYMLFTYTFNVKLQTFLWGKFPRRLKMYQFILYLTFPSYLR